MNILQSSTIQSSAVMCLKRYSHVCIYMEQVVFEKHSCLVCKITILSSYYDVHGRPIYMNESHVRLSVNASKVQRVEKCTHGVPLIFLAK